nr:hypothetical protein CFP56_39009 [Quercus suber]
MRSHNNGEDEEQTSLLSHRSETKSSLTDRAYQYLNQNVSRDWGDLLLLFCYTVTGLLDSSSAFIWGSFISMQTGQYSMTSTVVGLRQRLIRKQETQSTLVLVFSIRKGTVAGSAPRKRWVMVASFAFQLLLMVVAAVMVAFGPKMGQDGPVSVWIGLPIALCAFQSAGQAVSSRALGYSALTSVVLTSIYCDLFSDQKLFSTSLRENVERNRRVAAPTLLLIGAMIGAAWSKTDFGLAGALWTAVIMKAGIILAWLLWPVESEENDG